MKVALLFLGRKGGGEVYSLSIARQMQNMAEMVTFVSSYSENKTTWDKEIAKLHFIETYRNMPEFVCNTIVKKQISRIIDLIHAENPDIVYYPMLSPWTPIINQRLKDCKIVCTIHDYHLHKGERSLAQSYIKAKSIKQSDGLIFLSEAFKTEFNERYMYNKNRAKHVLHSPLGAFDLLKEDGFCYTPIEGRNNMLFLGRLLKYKGLDVLLKAYPIIKGEVTDCRLIIAGEGRLDKYRHLLLGQDDIELYNKWLTEEEIHGCLQKSDILVIPYTSASQSAVIALGQAYGIPIVTTRVGGIKEQISEGKTGILVDPNNVEDLAYACINLLQDSNMRLKLSTNELIYARDNLSWGVISKRIIDFFLEVMSK